MSKDYAELKLAIACDALRAAINRKSSIDRARDTYYSVKRPAYVDGVILHDRKVRK